jgi:glutathione S-transferase
MRLGPVNTFSSALASAMRAGNGRAVQPHRDAAQPLELWSFESSPYCRRVREVLSELEIAYVLHNLAKGSPKRDAFRARTGKVQVPYLEDPNTGTQMFESRDIVRYLRTTYGSPGSR